MEAAGRGKEPEPAKEAATVTPGKMVHGAARVHEIETSGHRSLKHRATEPSHPELPFVG
jgi:hypothetical protein